MKSLTYNPVLNLHCPHKINSLSFSQPPLFHCSQIKKCTQYLQKLQLQISFSQLLLSAKIVIKSRTFLPSIHILSKPPHWSGLEYLNYNPIKFWFLKSLCSTQQFKANGPFSSMLSSGSPSGCPAR